MPKERLKRVSHSALTDHRILARAGEPLPENAFHLTTSQLSDLVQVDSAPQPSRTPVPSLTLFRAYRELVATHPDYVPRLESTLDSLEAAKTGDATVLAALARRKMREPSAESRASAADYLQRALQAGSTDPNDFEQLAAIQAEGGKIQDAIATVRQGIEVNPYSPRLYGLLASLYASLGSYDSALKTMQKDLQLFPGDDYIRSVVQKIETEQVLGGGHLKDPR